ncbi:hypothetical protein I546_6944 [Mycobacterium kansasii 732]|nr:hypothetical protein I546_6944 [Mycobacterium kansasii 732]
MAFLAANCGERGGAGWSRPRRYAVDHGRALTTNTTTHKSGHYEEGNAAKAKCREGVIPWES